jgi:hypothetical protein
VPIGRDQQAHNFNSLTTAAVLENPVINCRKQWQWSFSTSSSERFPAKVSKPPMADIQDET